MTLHTAPVAQAQMHIRKAVKEVFDAFVNPATTTRFWFTKSSGTLEQGRQIRREWEMYGASAQVTVKRVKRD